MEFGLVAILGIVTVTILAIFNYFFSKSDFWKKRGVLSPPQVFLFGNFKDVMLTRISAYQLIKQFYVDYKNELVLGFYIGKKPMLLVKDPDLIKDVLIKDFSIFADRGIKIHEKVEPLSQHLVFLDPVRWRALRKKLTPTFSSGKIRTMFYLLLECGDHFENYMQKIAEKGEPVEIRELTARFTTDVIGSCAFGLEMNAISDNNSEFRRMGKKVFEIDWWKTLRNGIKEFIPWLYAMSGPVFYDAEITEFFTNFIKQAMDSRERNNERRNDFVDSLRDIKDNPDGVGDIELTEALIAAQSYVFFVAGFETTSTTMSNALYELAQNHLIQDKVRQEIKEELNNNDGLLKYDSIKTMSYLHKIFQETLRKYPAAPSLLRISSEPYTFSGTKITVPKGQAVVISVLGLHHDPDIWPNPDVFDPERFNEENVKNRHPMSYLPFGDGPRNCIGARFAVYQTKIGLIKMLLNYKVDVCGRTEIPYTLSHVHRLLTPKNGIYLTFRKIEDGV